MASNPLFDMLANLEDTKLPWDQLSEEMRKGYSQFMINRFLSSKQCYLPLLSVISTVTLTNEQHYEFWVNVVAKQKHWFNYKAYKTVKDTDDLAIYAIRHEYEVSEKDAQYYYENMSELDVKTIKNKWKEHYDLYEATNR